MELVAHKAPYQRSKRSTTQIMIELVIGLGVIFVASLVHYFRIGADYGLKALLMMVVSLVVTLFCDVLVASIRFKGEQKDFGAHIIREVKRNYSFITAVIFTLTLPIGTPYYVIIVGNIFATLLVKYVFGGFGQNIFNPAALARIFVALAFASTLTPYLGAAPTEAATNGGLLVAGATITSQFNNVAPAWLSNGGNIDLLRVFIGNYNGALGETFSFLIIGVGIVLAIREVINWRTPVFYIGTLALIAIPTALIAGVNVFENIALSIGLGGALFGAVFMLTDPVTSPTGNFGKALIGIIGAFFTVLIRLAGGYPEGVAFSIAFVNIVSPMIDKLAVGQTTTDLWKKYTTAAATLFVSVGTMSIIAGAKANAANGEPSTSTPVSYPSYEDETSGEDLTPPYIEYKRLAGQYSSPAPHDYASEFTANLEVVLDYDFNISYIEYISTSTPGYVKEPTLTQFSAIYVGMSVKEFQALPDMPTNIEAGATGEGEYPQHVNGYWFSSVAIYNAIKNALTGIEVYSGQYTDYVCDPEDYDGCTVGTMNVDVYVKEGKIETLSLSGEQSTSSFANKWKTAYANILPKYQGLEVLDFLAMVDETQLYDDNGTSLSAGVTYSGHRLFMAVQNALEGYGA